MRFSQVAENHEAVVALFGDVFVRSAGAEEGALITDLVRGYFTTTPLEDLYVFTASDNGQLAGAICFTRVRYAEDNRTVFILSPVAVATDRQGEGVGQALLRFGLSQLHDRGVDVVLTYGDPAYYSRVGFRQISTEQAQPPLPLSHPEGWLGQAPDGGDFAPLRGPSSCVSALNKPALW